MPLEKITSEAELCEPARSVTAAMMNGAAGKCPSCGSGKLFDSGLKIREECPTCSEEFHHHRADDLPAYLNIFVIGHIVVALTMIVMDMKIIGMWTLVALACTLAIILAVALMRPLKGMVVGAQWATRMHGFGGNDD